MRVVLDAKVLAPGFVGAASAAVRLIAHWGTGNFVRVYADPYFASRLSQEQVARTLALLRREAEMTPLTLVVSAIASHPVDGLVLSTGLSGQADVLATRDKQLLKLGAYGGLLIMHPADMLDLLTS